MNAGSAQGTHSLFISDLHLSEELPDITAAFLEFLAGPACDATRLYILGDLFEFWIGDDTLGEGLNLEITRAVCGLVNRGVGVFLMHGNRDFLVSGAFSEATGVTLLEDPTLVDLHGTPTLLLHGDTLCTDDQAYQAFRVHVRNPAVQRQFLDLPVAARRTQVGQARSASEREKQLKPAQIMDVAPATVEAILRMQGYPRMIHGHTHRPARHEHRVDGRLCERWVLSDWHTGGDYLRVDAAGCTRHPIAPGTAVSGT
jgi:UDP-2,3-diacylglucosamine hydrolase